MAEVKNEIVPVDMKKRVELEALENIGKNKLKQIVKGTRFFAGVLIAEKFINEGKAKKYVAKEVKEEAPKKK